MEKITIDLQEFDNNIKEWMLKQTKDKLNNRYKKFHLAEDMDILHTQMSRFFNGKKVAEDFYIKWFKWYSKNQ